jgi:HK97 family phage major capsid protein
MPNDINLEELAVEIKENVKTHAADMKKLVAANTQTFEEYKKVEAKNRADDEGKLAKMADDIIDLDTKLSASIESEKEISEKFDKLELAFKARKEFVPDDPVVAEQMIKGAHEFYKAIATKENPYIAKAVAGRMEKFNAYDTEFMTKYLHGRFNGMDHKAMSIGSGPDGGYLVIPSLNSNIIKKEHESSPVRQFAKIQPIATDRMIWTVDTENVTRGWMSERENPTETTTPPLKKREIEVHTVYSEPVVSQFFLEDSTIDAVQFISDHVGRDFGLEENTAFVSGNGIKKPRGFTTYDAGSDWGQIEQVDIDLFNTTDGAAYNDIIDLVTSLKASYHDNARFMINRLGYRAVLKLTDGNKQKVYLPAIEREGVFSGPTLHGYSLHMASDIASPGSAASPVTNALFIAFGDFAQGYVIVDRRGIALLRDPYTGKPDVKLFFTKRVGGDVLNFEAIKIGKNTST